jgi:hypothetical protein
MMRLLSAALLTTALSVTPALAQPATNPNLVGAWSVETYELKNGESPPVAGHIFFSERDWTVLFFVMGPDGKPVRGSGEGGTYGWSGTRLVLTHLHNLSVGERVGSLAPSPLQLLTRGRDNDAPTETCTVELVDDRLTLHFPSGNSMSFRRR